MKAIILVTLFAFATARPQFIYNSWPYATAATPLTYSTWGVPATTYSVASAPAITYTAPAAVAAVPLVTKTQYHAQDELGQASFGYSHPGQAHAAVRDAFGGVRGSYAYIGADGKEVRVNYVADAVNGFRVESNALPQAPAIPEVPALIAPVPVADTPEVAAAKAQHLAAIEEAKKRNEEADKKDAMEKEMGMEGAEMKAEAPAAAEEAPKSEGEGSEAQADIISASRKKRDIYAYSAPIYHAPVIAQAPVLTSYQIAHPTVALRSATLTKVVNNPGHAISYRVD